MDLEKWKKKLKETLDKYPRLGYYLFGEFQFKTRWKVLMWLIQFAVVITLAYYVLLAPDFRLQKQCVELQPLIQGVLNGTIIAVQKKDFAGVGDILVPHFNLTTLNWTTINSS